MTDTLLDDNQGDQTKGTETQDDATLSGQSDENQTESKLKSKGINLALLVTTVIGAALALTSFPDVDPLKSDALGLIEGMPPLYFIGAAILVGSFGISLARNPLNNPLLTLQIFLTIVVLYGLASYAEDVARLPTGWVHAGFIDHIQKNDAVLENYDARMVWPAFFAFGAMLNELAGTTVSDHFLIWAPLVQVLLYSIPVWVIARGVGAPSRAAWLATMFFVLLNWVGQDYYSPQGFNMLLAVCFLAILFRVFFSDGPLIPTWIEAVVNPTARPRTWKAVSKLSKIKLTPAAPEQLQLTGVQEAALVGALAIVFTASVASHQLTPFFIIVATVALVILGRLRLRVFPLFMVICVLVWISYAATPFWAGKLEALFGDVGNVNSTLDQNVASRVTGDPAHLPVIYGRLALAIGVWAVAVLGVLRRMKTGKLDVLCIVGFLAPFTILGGQAYGGEAMLRVYLFALPFAATLAAMLIAPREQTWSLLKGTGVGLLLIAMLPVFFITRYGNEAFEAFSGQEYELVEKAMELAPDGAQMFSVNSQLPWRQERIADMTFLAFTETEAGHPEDLNQAAFDLTQEDPSRPSFFVLTRGQDAYAQIVEGLGDHYATDLGRSLVETRGFRIAYQNDHGMIVVPNGQS